MDVIFKSLDPEVILQQVNMRLNKSSLRNMVSLVLEEDRLIMTVSKLGKSKIYLKLEKGESEIRFTVEEENIRPQHRPLRSFVLDEICNILEQSGGTIIGR